MTQTTEDLEAKPDCEEADAQAACPQQQELTTRDSDECRARNTAGGDARAAGVLAGRESDAPDEQAAGQKGGDGLPITDRRNLAPSRFDGLVDLNSTRRAAIEPRAGGLTVARSSFNQPVSDDCRMWIARERSEQP